MKEPRYRLNPTKFIGAPTLSSRRWVLLGQTVIGAGEL